MSGKNIAESNYHLPFEKENQHFDVQMKKPVQYSNKFISW